MTEDSYVDTRVREFADHIQCNPELAQELYFEHKVSEALDNEQKASVDREFSTLRIVSNNLDRAAKACKTLSIYDDDLRNALRINELLNSNMTIITTNSHVGSMNSLFRTFK